MGAREGRALSVEVADDGPGIPADLREAVFLPFRQGDDSTRRSHGGTGLGLAISKRLCELQRLRLVLSSVEGEGATFAVLFDPTAPMPIHVAPASVDGSPSQTSPA